jgi:hypothetical protein
MISSTQYLDVNALGKVLATALFAGAGLVGIYSLGIAAVARSRVDQQGTASSVAAPWLALALLCLLVVVASVGYGIYVILAK